MGIINYITFVATAVFFIMTPGIDTMFVLNKSIAEGRRAGIYSTLGINAGVIVHTLFAALGLSGLIAKSAMAFEMVKYLGAAYIIYLGFINLITNRPSMSIQKKGIRTDKFKGNNFLSGLATNTFNPKVALFFLAFFPQFILKEELESPVPFIFLGMTYALIGCIWYAVLSLFAGTFSASLKANPKADHWLQRFSGVIFILMGLKIAFPK